MKKLFTLVFMLTAVFASAQSIIYVNATTGNDSNDGLSATVSGSSGPKLSLSGQNGALSLATDGDIVSVESGFYTEDVIIDKSVVLLKTGATTAYFSSFTFSGGAQLVAPKPAPSAFSAQTITVNPGSSISDGVNMVSSNGTVYVGSGNYDETVTLTKTFQLTFLGASTVRDIVLAGADIHVYSTGDVQISGSLQLNRPEGGYLVLSTSNVSILPGALVFPGNGNSYVKTVGAGLLSVPVNVSGATIIPVGTEDLYAPISISAITPSNTASVAGRVRSAGNPISFNPDLSSQVNSHIRLEWEIHASGSVTAASVRFDYTGAVEPSDWATVANRVIAQSSGTNWVDGTNVNIGESFSTANFTSLNGVFAIYSDFPNAIASTSTTSISLYPNPFQDVVRMNVSAGSQEHVVIQLLDLSGRIVSQKQTSLNVGDNTIQLSDLQSAAPGMYVVRLAGNQTDITLRAVKF